MFKGVEEGEEEEEHLRGQSSRQQIDGSTREKRRDFKREVERESGRSDDGCRQQIGVRERRSGFAVEVKIARGRKGFGRGNRRAYGTGKDRLREREAESTGRRRGAWKEAAEY